MTVQIKTMDFEPKRQTFGHIARRLGEDKPASRYQEATLDVQATANFHYKPLYEPEFWHYDTRQDRGRDGGLVQAARSRASIYYATYNFARANMNQAAERNFAFAEERGLIDKLSRRGARGDRARPAAAAPPALGREYEHDRNLPARLRHGGHRALHLLRRRSSRHGADHQPHRPRRWTARPAPASTRPRRPGCNDPAWQGVPQAHRRHLRRARLVPALCRADPGGQRRRFRPRLQALRRRPGRTPASPSPC